MVERKMEKFQKDRERLNRIVLQYSGTNIKRFFSIDLLGVMKRVSRMVNLRRRLP